MKSTHLKFYTFAVSLFSIIGIGKGNYIHYKNAECIEGGNIAAEAMIHVLDSQDLVVDVVEDYRGQCKFYDPDSLSVHVGHCISCNGVVGCTSTLNDCHGFNNIGAAVVSMSSSSRALSKNDNKNKNDKNKHKNNKNNKYCNENKKKNTKFYKYCCGENANKNKNNKYCKNYNKNKDYGEEEVQEEEMEEVTNSTFVPTDAPTESYYETEDAGDDDDDDNDDGGSDDDDNDNGSSYGYDDDNANDSVEEVEKEYFQGGDDGTSDPSQYLFSLFGFLAGVLILLTLFGTLLPVANRHIKEDAGVGMVRKKQPIVRPRTGPNNKSLKENLAQNDFIGDDLA